MTAENKKVEIHKCFISSPNDTLREREKCEDVFKKINATLGISNNFRIESVRWEKDCHSETGSSAQKVINSQLDPQSCSFYLGILAKNFGSRTEEYDSGTEEEFNLAYKCYEKNNNPEILFYFKSFNINSNDPLINEINKINSFKNRIKENVLYREYENCDDFYDKLYMDFYKIFEKKFNKSKEGNSKDTISSILEQNVKMALFIFEGLEVKWIDRILSNNSNSRNPSINSKDNILYSRILDFNQNCIIKAPSQFGLTSLSHQLIYEAWEKRNEIWIYLDLKEVSYNLIELKINAQLKIFNSSKIDCIVVDSWDQEREGNQKVLEVIEAKFTTSKILLMETVIDTHKSFCQTQLRMSKTLATYFLLPMPKGDLRVIVHAYSKLIKLENDKVLNKITSDFEYLNIHRIPLNCWMFLKALENGVNDIPTNRTQLLDVLIKILYDVNSDFNYGISPSSKDCEYLLGYFCEHLIRNRKTFFSESELINFLKDHIDKKLVKIDVYRLVEILKRNKIIIKAPSRNFKFIALFWMNYFAAKQMHNNENFKEYILTEKRYAENPEIIDFYTGINNRGNSEILTILKDKLTNARKILCNKADFEKIINPYKDIKFSIDEKSKLEIHNQIKKQVEYSGADQKIKDLYSDKNYNMLSAYSENFPATILEDHSFKYFVNNLKIASNALRNSDFANEKVRKEILIEIVKSWIGYTKTLIMLIPYLANNRVAFFEGYTFKLSDEFEINDDQDNHSFYKLCWQILLAIPYNVITHLSGNLSSERLSPLVQDYLKTPRDSLSEFLIIFFLIREGSKDDVFIIKDYIMKLNYDSVYLEFIIKELSRLKKYENFNAEELNIINSLLTECKKKFQSKTMSRRLNRSTLLKRRKKKT